MIRRLFVVVLLLWVAVSGCRDRKRSPDRSSSAPEAATNVVPSALVPATGRTSKEWRDAHSFYGVYLEGAKIGWAEEKITRVHDGGVQTRMKVQLRMVRSGTEMTMSIAEDTVFDAPPDGRLRRYQALQEMGEASRVVYDGKRDGEDFVMQVTVGEKTQTKTIPLPKLSVADRVPRLRIARLLAGKPGETVTEWEFDSEQLRDERMESKVLSKQLTRLHGVPVTLVVVETYVPNEKMTMTTRLTAKGQVLETQVGHLFRLVLEDKNVAQDVQASSPDMFKSSTIALDRPLGEPDAVHRLSLRLTGVPSGVDLNDARQVWKDERLTIRRVPLESLPAEPLSTDGKHTFLEVTPFIDHDDPALYALLAQVSGDKGTLAHVRSLNHRVYESLSYTLETAPESASEILQGGRGDCSEYTRLFVALCRAAGYPAREVTGVAYSGDSEPGLVYHAWGEVYVQGRWLASDPTWDQVPVDATHVTFARGSGAGFMGLVGGVKATVLSVNGQ